MHDGHTVVHACEWLTLVTVPLDLPPSLDVVLFNVTPSSLIVPTSISWRPPLVSRTASLSTPIYARCVLVEILIDSILFLGINTSRVFFHLHLFLKLSQYPYLSTFSHRPFCGVTYTTHILTARLSYRKRHSLPKNPSHTKQVHLLRGSFKP